MEACIITCYLIIYLIVVIYRNNLRLWTTIDTILSIETILQELLRFREIWYFEIFYIRNIWACL